MNMETKTTVIDEQQKTRYQLLGLFKSLVTYFSQSKNLPMKGWLTLDYGNNRCVFDLTVFSSWHRESNRSFSFYVFSDFEEQKVLSQKVIKAIELDDFEKIIELSEHDRRTRVQKYIDRTYGPYTCDYCELKQHDPFVRIRKNSPLILCEKCTNKALHEIYMDGEELEA